MQCRDVEDLGGGEVAGNVAGNETAGVVGNDLIAVEVGVVEDVFQIDSACSDGFKTEDGMVDRSEDAICDDSERQTARGDVVDGEKVVGDGNHESAGTLDEEDVVARCEELTAAVDGRKVDRAAVDTRGELCGGGVGEYDRRSGEVCVFRERACAGETAVELDVLGATYVAGLDEFLSYYRQASVHHLTCEPGCAVAFSGVSVDAGYE